MERNSDDANGPSAPSCPSTEASALFAAAWRDHPDHILLIDSEQRVHADNRSAAPSNPPHWPGLDTVLDGACLRTVQNRHAAARAGSATTFDEIYDRDVHDHERWTVIRLRRLDEHNDLVLATLSDVSSHHLAARDEDRRHAEARHRQQIETLGTLATGVAHEINNPVQAIVSCSELLLAELGESSESRELARDVLGEAHRIAKVVRTLMDFARPQPEELRAEDPALIIERALVWTRMLLRRDIINLRVQVEPGLPKVRCRPREIQTVLLNLVTNAREALQSRSHAGDESTVTIGARLGDSAGTVCLVVQDDGPGIPATAIERIFDPFYTTKPDNQGTGLGLYLARKMVVALGGRITVRSAPGVATRFAVELPVYEASSPRSPS